MTTHKTISSLSIAAIALVTAVAAQAQTDTAGKNASASATTVVEQTIASNLESAAVRKSRVTTPEVEPAANNAVRTIKPLALSTSAFKGQSHFTSAASNSSLVNQMNFNAAGPIDPGAKKQFRADESETSRTKPVAFVPSRGQKLPE